MEDKPFIELIGKTVENIYFGKNKKEEIDYYNWLKFQCEKDEEFVYHLEADCCSDSYFWNIDDIPKHIMPVKINNVTYIPNVGGGKATIQEEDLIYFIFFTFIPYDNPYHPNNFYIAFRNSSNGYYNGDIKLLEKDHSYFKATCNDIEWNSVKIK